jgi:hypothetical protein
MTRIQNSQETKQIYLSIKTEYSPEHKSKASDPVENPKNESETYNSVKKTPTFQNPNPNLKKKAAAYVSARSKRYGEIKTRLTNQSSEVFYSLSQNQGLPQKIHFTHSKTDVIR